MMILIKRFGKAVVGLLDGMRRIEGEWVSLAMGAIFSTPKRFNNWIENLPKPRSCISD